MYKIEPPLEERELDEVVAIAHSTSDKWQPEVIELAKQELKRRDISLEEQEKIINQWHKNIEDWENTNSTEGYSKWEMIKILFLAPAYLTCQAIPDYSLSELKADNYLKKYKQRIIQLIAGTLLYFVMMAGMMFYIDYSSKRNTEKADITEWENNRIIPNE